MGIGLAMVLLWCSDGASVGVPLYSLVPTLLLRGAIMELPWDFHGNSMGLSWNFHWASVELRTSDGNSALLPWCFHGTSKFYRYFRGTMHAAVVLWSSSQPHIIL